MVCFPIIVDTNLAQCFVIDLELTDGSGSGRTLQEVVLGRVLSGIGGAGIHCLVSIVIAGTNSNCCFLDPIS